jgi:hypothetical protein
MRLPAPSVWRSRPLFGGQWRRHFLLSVGDLGTCRRPGPDSGEGTNLCEIVLCGAGLRAGLPKDGNWADQRLYAGSLVIESSLGLSAC